MTIGDYPDWGGVPLLGVDAILNKSNGYSLNVPAAGMAGNPATLYSGPITGISYAVTIDALTTVTGVTTIAAGSAGAALPQAVIFVASSAAFRAGGGSAVVFTSNGAQPITYTGVAAGSLTGCSGGSGTMSLGAQVQDSPEVPFYQIAFQWKSGVTLIGLEHWITFPSNVAPPTSTAIVSGRGPAETANLTLLVKNFDDNPINVSYNVQSSGRFVTRDDLRHISSNILNSYAYQGLAFSTPVSEPSGLMVGNSPGIVMAPGFVASRLLPMFAGQQQFIAQVTNNNPANNVNMQVSIYEVDPNFAAPLQQIWQQTNTTTPSWQIGPLNFSLSRMPTIVVFKNLSATETCTSSYTLIGQEFAS